MRSRLRAWGLILLGLCAGCFPVSGAPRLVRVAELVPPQQEGRAREATFTVVVDRFLDQRASRNILGQYDVGGRGGFLGTVTVASDKDVSEVFETLVKRSLQRKGISEGTSPLLLRGAIQQVNVGAAPDSQTIKADIGLELTIVDSGSGALLWQKSYQGVAVGNEPQPTLALAFRDLDVALNRDDSILGLKRNFVALGGALPGGPAAASSGRTEALAGGPVSDVDTPALGRAAQRVHDFAVVIGIDKYQSVPDTSYAQRDAATVRLYMGGMGVPEENIVYLTGDRATRTGIAKYLEEWLPRNVTEESRVYFYFAGHGAPEPDTGTAYLLPWDGDPAFLPTTAYPLSRLYEKLNALKAREVIVMLDSCFSGAGGRSVMAKGVRPVVLVRADGAQAGGKISVLTASSATEITSSLEDQGHGMFTYYLLKGLGGEADAARSGHVSLGDLSAYVQKNVQKAARRQNREQTPQLRSARPDLRIY